MLVEYFPAVTFLLVALFHCLFTLPFDMLDDRPSCLTNEAGPIYLSYSSSVSAPVGNCEQNKRKRANSPLIPSRDETSKLSCLLLLHIVQFSTVPSSKRQHGCNTESFNWIFTTWWVIIREKNSLFLYECVADWRTAGQLEPNKKPGRKPLANDVSEVRRDQLSILYEAFVRTYGTIASRWRSKDKTQSPEPGSPARI